jgi:hypothetical protein
MARQNEAGKIEAIYNLREAAVYKGRLEQELEHGSNADKRDALLDAHLILEDRTVRAIEACHECGLPHAPDEPHGRVRHVDFSRNAENERDSDAGRG